MLRGVSRGRRGSRREVRRRSGGGSASPRTSRRAEASSQSRPRNQRIPWSTFSMRSRGSAPASSSQIGLVQRRNLGRIHDGVAREPGSAAAKEGVARSSRQQGNAFEQTHYNGVDSASVHVISLENQHRVTIARFRSAGLPQIGPPDLSALDHRRAASEFLSTAFPRFRRATATGSSPGCPASSMTWFQAAVASGGNRRRARYSRTASAKRRLRDTLSRREQSSTSRKSSSRDGDGGFHILEYNRLYPSGH